MKYFHMNLREVHSLSPAFPDVAQRGKRSDTAGENNYGLRANN